MSTPKSSFGEMHILPYGKCQLYFPPKYSPFIYILQLAFYSALE